MLDNLIGLARTFEYLYNRDSVELAESVTKVATRLCRADMGAAAAQYFLPEDYQIIVRKARKWLRDQDTALA